MTRRSRARLVVVAICVAVIASGCSGYSVEDLGNSADERLSAFQDADTTSLGELLGLEACDRVEIVGAYTTNEQKEAQIGNANVDLSSRDQYTVVVAFEGEEVLRAVRLARVPLDLDSLSGRSFSCDTTVRSDQGRAILGSG